MNIAFGYQALPVSCSYYQPSCSYYQPPQPKPIDEDYKKALIELNEEFPGATPDYEYSTQELEVAGIDFRRK
jgi:hypothetical protein